MRSTTPRRTVPARALATILLLTSLLGPTVAAHAATASARTIVAACPASRTPDGDFRDTSGTTFELEIDCIHAYAVDAGITVDRSYLPAAQTTRAEMATFLANLLRASGRERPARLPNAFSDDDGSAHRANIDWLADLGIVRGRTDGSFEPEGLVTRAQLASFVNRTIAEITGSSLRSDIDWFADDQGSVHEPSINGVAAQGLVTGTAPDTYSPAAWSTRGQMAAFLARTVAELVDRGEVDPFGPRAITVTPATAANLPNSDNGSSTTRDRGQRSYSVAVPLDVVRVTIVLMPTSQVRTGSNGQPLFTSNAPLASSLGVGIEVVQGVRIDQVDRDRDVVLVDDVPVGSDGVVTFVVDAITMAGATPVVFADTMNRSSDRLDLPTDASATNPREALEAVGLGGATTWGPNEPAAGQDLGPGIVRGVDLAAGWYLLDTGGSTDAEWVVRFRDGDQFTYTASNEPIAGSPGPITRQQFTQWLSVGDRVDPGAYGAGMRHTITGDVPLAPTGVAAVATGNGDIRVTYTRPSNPVADDAASSYRLERAAIGSGGTVGTWGEVGSRTGDRTTEFVDAVPSAGAWAYRVVARSVTGSSPASNVVSATAIATPPTTTRSRISADNGSDGRGSANRVLDRGDTLEFTFDRAITVDGNWAITIQDRDGTRGVLDNMTATPVLSSDRRVLTVYIGTPGPRIVRDGTANTIDLSPSTQNTASTGFLQVVSSQGIGASGAWNLPASGLAGSPGNGSRTILDGTGGGRLTPAAPTGHIVAIGGTTVIEFGRNEVQVVTLTTATEGTWRLGTGGGVWTQPLALDATPATIQAELEALAGIGAGNVVVSGGPINVAAVTVSFTGALSATDVATLVLDGDTLAGPETGWTAPAVETTQQGQVVTGIAAGDRVSVFTEQGAAVAAVDAGANGRTTVTLSSAMVKGTRLLVVVESKATGRFSTTLAVTVA